MYLLQSALSQLEHYIFVVLNSSPLRNKKSNIYLLTLLLLIGIDATSVYTSKMAGQDSVKGDRALREFVNEPVNYCTLLSQETNGAIFDSGLLGTKEFDEVFVKRIVKNSEPSQCQVCKCVEDRMVGVGRSVCEKCVDPINPLQHVSR